MEEIKDFDLNLLRVFDAMWRQRHLSRAAEELGLSQPAMSHALKRLRERIGDQLFFKVRTGMQPSPRAEQLAPVVRSVLTEVRDLILTAPQFHPGDAQRIFTIATSEVGELAVLPRLLTQVIKEAPHVDIETVAASQGDLMGLLERGRADLAIGFFPDLIDTDLFEQTLTRRGFVCLARAGHPIASRKMTEQQFCAASHAIVGSDSWSLELAEKYLHDNGIRPHAVFRTPRSLSIPMVIASTDLIVTVAEPIADIFARVEDLRQMTPPYPLPSFLIKQHWHRTQHEDPANRWLRSLVHESCEPFAV
ncbi:LysR family transcriptional regulator [Caballeronia humi]|uniref:LysR family transcriptional regulator n=1 Tax=Caballeronia humi TaxID=326474 RepID=A0A158HHV3_9BURK|nr:LysR family transcriptional regulator [Caballeronia humi]SAL43619.1 LysR family transcriptional regulator [Caballeronia humi]